MLALPFLNRLWLHYSIYRGYPLTPAAALRNAWRIARRWTFAARVKGDTVSPGDRLLI